jgi:LPXTG-motif cell wall-anchored protein
MISSLSSPRRILLALAAAAPLLIAALVVPAASAASDLGWEVSTVDGTHGTDRANYDYTLDSGAQVDDSIRVSNTGTDAVTVGLYAADGFTTSAGAFDLRTRDDEPKAVGAWLTLDAEQVTVQPGEAADVPFRIAVPDGARGEYVGGIVTTDASASDAVEQRAAVRVRLHVGSSFRPALSIEDVQVDYASALLGAGRARVTYTVRNTGDTVISSEQSIAVAGPFGLATRRAGDYQSTPQLLPGEDWTISADIDGVLPLAVLTANVSAVPLYVDAAGSTGPLRAIDQTGVGAAVPWMLLVALVIVLVALLWWVRRRRARAATPVPTDAPTAH